MLLHAGDCLSVPWRSKRNAWITDPPANITFMGRKWDKAAAELGFAPPLPPRSKKHLRELQSEYAFQRYWGERFGMMFDQSEDDAVAFVWALPRTAHLTQTALRWAGWRILDSWHHVFGQGWNKNGGHLKPAHEVWFVALKGKPELNIDAGRVKRGGDSKPVPNGGRMGYGGGSEGYDYTPNALSSHPPNFALSHHPSCVRIGERKVKASAPRTHNGENHGASKIDPRQSRRFDHWQGFADDDGTESLPAYSCAVSCPCGRHWTQPSSGSPSECECGRQGEWVCPVAELDEQSGTLHTHGNVSAIQRGLGYRGGKGATLVPTEPSSGGASRFFPSFGYYAKASGRTDGEGVPRGERHAGCEDLYWRANKDNPFGFDRVTREDWEGLETKRADCFQASPSVSVGNTPQNTRARGNVHPTVKSIEMMMYLAKLSGGDKIGDLCFGSGGTAIACQLLGIDFEGAELCPEAVEITNARLAYWNTLSLSALHELILAQPIQRVLKVNEKSRVLAANEVQ